MKSRVRIAVVKLLAARDGVAVPDHLVLLQLSRDAEGRPKLLTTNFDTLFERAAHAAGLNTPSHLDRAFHQCPIALLTLPQGLFRPLALDDSDLQDHDTLAQCGIFCHKLFFGGVSVVHRTLPEPAVKG